MLGPDEYWSFDSDPYIDRRTGILKNIQDLQTEAQLEAFEEIVFQAHYLEAVSYVDSCSVYSLDVWRTLHGICFFDIYDWAGELRTVRISKGSTVFAYPEHIIVEADRLFSGLNAEIATGRLTLESAAIAFAEQNVIHPFREGNGRTQRIIFSAVMDRIGYQVDYNLWDSDELITALIQAYHGRYELIIAAFKKICGVEG